MTALAAEWAAVYDENHDTGAYTPDPLSAGRRALAREDLPAAINLLRRALVPLGPGERLEVLVDLAEALLSSGDTVAAASVVDELGRGAEEAGDERANVFVLLDVFTVRQAML